MMFLITRSVFGAHVEDLHAMHRLRYQVFKERLDWEVQTSGDLEIDGFDVLDPAYLVQRSPTGEVQGCVRLLPTSGPNMLRDVFPSLLGGTEAPAAADIWESSRFALHLPQERVRDDAGTRSSSVATATFELFLGMVEFGLARGLSRIVTVTDLRMERILRRASWPLERIAEPQTIGKTQAVAGYLEVSMDAVHRLRDVGGIDGPVLWVPAVQARVA
jgi:N-acyl-L-homoserine lactone synthetase